MSKQVKIGNITIGGGNRIAVQSMTTFPPKKIKENIAQINALETAGADIVRFCALDEEDISAIKAIKKQTRVPLVADIHYDYRLALGAISAGIDKIRINPGNIGSDQNIKKVADALKGSGIPARVGSNTGSIEKDFLLKYGRNEISLCESALKNVAILEKNGVENIVISVKATDVNLTIKAYEYLAKRTDYPLHIGVTEAGVGYNGIVKNAIGIGSLLLKGIGDTLRVSLSADPIEEIKIGREILRATGKEKNFAELVACPTCGRCEWDCMSFAAKTNEFIKDIAKPIKIAVMGCVVNGIGEGKDADIGVAGGKDGLVIFKKGEIYKKVSYAELEKVFFDEIKAF